VKRSAKAPFDIGSSQAAVGILLVASIAIGCREGRDAARDTVPAAPVAADTSRSPECAAPVGVNAASHGRFVEWARTLEYAASDSVRGYVSAFRPTANDSLRVEVVEGARTRSRAALARGCLIARLISNRADSRLGVARGTNYVWADSTAIGGHRVIIIPETSARLTFLPMVIHEHRIGAPISRADSGTKRPCSECLPDGWCRYPRFPAVAGDSIFRLMTGSPETLSVGDTARRIRPGLPRP
jgi:hypothetical protein